MSELKYKRILLKVSGEALGEKTAAGDGFGLDFTKINAVCASIKECVDMGVQVGLVIGGGNFWRGVKNGSGKMQRSHADAMGMLATVMNAIAVADALEEHGMDARVLTAVEMHKFAEYFTRDTANRYLNEGKVVLFAAGTGNPYFSTDTGAVLRGVEIEADAVLMAKNIDGIYSADPHKDETAVLLPCVGKIDEHILSLAGVSSTTQGTGGMVTKLHAAEICLSCGCDMVIANGNKPENLYDILDGKDIGTTFTERCL